MLRPALFLVITLGLIGTWQVFDQVYVMGKGAPGKTTLTPGLPVVPAELRQRPTTGTGAAIAFVLLRDHHRRACSAGAARARHVLTDEEP